MTKIELLRQMLETLHCKFIECLNKQEITFAGNLEQGKVRRNYSKMSVYDRMEALRKELKGQSLCCYFWVVDLFDDAVVIETYPDQCGDCYPGAIMLRFPYTIENDVVSFGSPAQVEKLTTYAQVEPVEGEDPPAENQNAKEQFTLVQGTSLEKIPLHATHNLRLVFEQEVLEQAKKKSAADLTKPMKFKDGVATVFNIINANGQFYPGKVWQDNLAQLNERAAKGQVLGEADHPEKASISRQCIKYEKFWIQGNEMHCSGEILPTEVGRDLMVLAAADCPIPLSSRGFGAVELQEVNGKKALVVQDGFHCETFDAVTKPAAFDSFIEEFTQSTQPKVTQELTQSIKKGELKPMPEWLKQLMQALAQAEVLLKQGKEGAQELVEELNGLQTELEQMQKDGVGEDVLTRLMKPYAEKVAAAIGKPADPDKNVGTFLPGRQSQSVQANPQPLDQSVHNDLQILSQAAKRLKIDELVQGVEPTLQHIYRQQLEALPDAKTIESSFETMKQNVSTILGLGGTYFASAGIGQVEREKRYNAAPKSPEEYIQKVTADMKEVIDPLTGVARQDPSNPRWVMQTVLRNMARENKPAMSLYLTMLQGRLDQAGEQTTSDLTTANAFLFPMIRRAYDMMILNKIASIQPMSSDSGKIYYLDTKNEADEDLSVTRSRTYADGVAELTGVPKKIKVVLSSENVTADKKALQTEVSYEVIQDMMNKFGLDAQEETLTAAATEIARERNYDALYDLINAAGTAGNVNFGLLAPSAYTQVEWEQQQLWLALQKLSNLIYTKRYGEMTDLFAGTNACLQLAKLGSKGGFISTIGDSQSQIYAGLNLFGTVNGQFNIWKVPYLDDIANNQVLALRKGPQWSDTPYVFAPYTTAVTPAIHSVNLKVNQAIMERSAAKVVVPTAIATLTFQPATEGTPI